MVKHILTITSCLRLRLTCRGAAYSSQPSGQFQFHVTTPRSYKTKQESGALQCRYSNSTTCSLPPISAILGTSKCDIFSTAGVSDTSVADHRNLYHAIVCQWLDFNATDKQGDLSMVRSEVMSHALNDPVARYTIIYLGATHHAFVSPLQTLQHGSEGCPSTVLHRHALLSQDWPALISTSRPS